MSGRQGLPPASARSCRAWTAGAEVRPVPGGTAAVGIMLRLPVFVVTSGLLALVAHGAASGALPDARSLLAAVALTAAVGAVLCRRRRSFEAIVTALVAAQTLVHVVLCLPHLVTATTVDHAAHHGPAAASLVARLVPGGPMLVAHVLAAGVAAWWLARGEAAVWSTVRGWFPALALLAVRPSAPAPCLPTARTAADLVVLHDQVPGRRTRPRRGPPALVIACA